MVWPSTCRCWCPSPASPWPGCCLCSSRGFPRRSRRTLSAPPWRGCGAAPGDFDWLYDRLLTRPFVRAATLGRNDVADRLIGVIPATLRGANAVLAWTQTGNLRWYAAVAGAGTCLLLGSWRCAESLIRDCDNGVGLADPDSPARRPAGLARRPLVECLRAGDRTDRDAGLARAFAVAVAQRRLQPHRCRLHRQSRGAAAMGLRVSRGLDSESRHQLSPGTRRPVAADGGAYQPARRGGGVLRHPRCRYPARSVLLQPAVESGQRDRRVSRARHVPVRFSAGK